MIPIHGVSSVGRSGMIGIGGRGKQIGGDGGGGGGTVRTGTEM
ncbi:MAG: hypothetical protein HZLCBSQH_000471 [Candidatus Fervidibacterota bacterium]